MDPTTRIALLGAAGAGENNKITHPLLFLFTRGSSKNWLHAIRTNGTKEFSLEIPVVPDRGSGFFRNPYLYFGAALSPTIYRVDCKNATLSTITRSYNFGNAFYTSFSPSSMISVSSRDNYLEFLDASTGTFSGSSYDADDGHTDLATSHTTLGFFDQTSAGITNIKNRYWWTSFSQISGTGFHYYADRSGSTLGSRSSGFNTGQNGSRAFSVHMSSTKGAIVQFGRLYRYTDTASSPTFVNYGSNYSFGGNTYSPAGVDVSNPCPLFSTDSRLYHLFQDSSPGTSGYRFRLATYDPFSSTSPTSTDCGVEVRYRSPTDYYWIQDGLFGCKINDAGYFALACLDKLTYGNITPNYKISIVNGSSVVATYTGTLGSGYVDTVLGNNPLLNCYCWSTDLVYPGSTYT